LNILIIGINSFLAKEIVRFHLKDAGVQFTGVYNCNYPVSSSCKIIPATEIFNLDDSFNLVYIIAAYVPEDLNVYSDLLYTTNTELPGLVARHFKKAKIIFASTVSVYGDATGTIDEFTIPLNPGYYGASKLEGEKAIAANADAYALVRFSSIFGLGMKQTTIIPNYLNQALTDKCVNVWGDGCRLQNYIHVTDAAAIACKAALNKQNGIFLGIANEHITNLQLAQIIKSKVRDIRINFTGADSSLSKIYNNDWTKEQLQIQEIHSQNKISTLVNQWEII
jgi:UDP-glucose 4-epimerase